MYKLSQITATEMIKISLKIKINKRKIPIPYFTQFLYEHCTLDTISFAHARSIATSQKDRINVITTAQLSISFR